MKNIIELAKDNGASPNDLVKVLLSYTAALPSVAEVAFQANALTASQVLEVFLLQSKEGLSFRSACEKSGAWTEAVQAAIVAQAQRGQADLGALLVAHSLLTPEQFQPAAGVAAPAPIVGAAISASLDIELSVDERRMLCDLLADDAKDKFFAALATIEKGEAVGPSFEAIHQIVHETKGILRFIALPVIEATVERAEQITEALTAHSELDGTIAKDVVATFRTYGDAMWNLKKDGAAWPESTVAGLFNQLQNKVPSQKEAA